jgi:hypothetical protein
MSSNNYTSSCDIVASSPPGDFAACAVTLEKNNAAIFKECCDGAPIISYSSVNDKSPYCYQSCIISGPTYENSSLYLCLHNSNNTDWTCWDQKVTSGAHLRVVDKMFLVVAAIAVGGFVMNVERL